MKIVHTIAIVAASSFLTLAVAQAAPDARPTNMNGQPLVANEADMHPMTGRSAMMMKHHHYHHPMMMHRHYHHHMKPMMTKKPM